MGSIQFSGKFTSETYIYWGGQKEEKAKSGKERVKKIVKCVSVFIDLFFMNLIQKRVS